MDLKQNPEVHDWAKVTFHVWVEKGEQQKVEEGVLNETEEPSYFGGLVNFAAVLTLLFSAARLEEVVL